MANKRMLSKNIVDTDEFLNMPVSSQNLYFHLCVRADDDGFVGKFKAIMRMVQASEDDAKILMAKNLIIYFDTGICVITHWFLHNTIRPKRKIQTLYILEKNKLALKSGIYYSVSGDDQLDDVHAAGICTSNVPPMYAESSVVEYSIDEYSRVEYKEKNTLENKKKYGKLNNILLTTKEYEEIKNQQLQKYIDIMSFYLASTGKKYKSHYATILGWSRKDKIAKEDTNERSTTSKQKYANIGETIETDGE